MLETIGSSIDQNLVSRHLFFFVSGLLAISLVGFHVGTFDQIVHLPFLKKNVNPTLYPGDPFMQLRSVHYSFFWVLFRPFYRQNFLYPAMLAVHILATYFTLWI